MLEVVGWRSQKSNRAQGQGEMACSLLKSVWENGWQATGGVIVSADNEAEGGNEKL